MKAEFLKLKSMPTPLWTAAALVFCFVAGLVVSFIWGIGDDNAALDGAIGLPMMIASLVIGSWIVGVEFGQNTLRRVLGTDPRRTRLVLVKLAVLLIVITVATVGLLLLGTLLYGLAGTGHSPGVDYGESVRIGAATLVTNYVWAIAAMSLTLLTRSMAGGITLTFAFIFVIDGLLSLIPKVGDYTLGIASTDVDLAIRGQSSDIFDQTATHETMVSVIVLAVWLLVFVISGIVRTNVSEVK